MILRGKELFLIVDSLFNRICVICNTKEEAEKELKNKLINSLENYQKQRKKTENKKKDDKNEQSIQDIQKRILLKHFIKNWYADELDYCDSSTKKCTHNSCLDHYLEYYIENKLWDKIV